MYPGAHLAQHADKAAVVMAGTGWTQTFAELDAAANRLSRLLRESGLEPGDHVAICMENHPRYLEVLWGCNYAGLIYTAASSRLTAEELGYVVDDCGARVFITSHHLSTLAGSIVDATPHVERRLMLDGTIEGHESYEAAVAQHDASPSRRESLAPTCCIPPARPVARKACYPQCQRRHSRSSPAG